MDRPSFEIIYMSLAKLMSARSTCERLSVGTVITSADYRRVLAVGYNGNASGLDNKCDLGVVGGCGCLHSEENAIINCDSPREVDKVVFITHSPCKMCIKRIINLGGVKKVYYTASYRDPGPLELFDKVGIKYSRLEVE